MLIGSLKKLVALQTSFIVRGVRLSTEVFSKEAEDALGYVEHLDERTESCRLDRNRGVPQQLFYRVGGLADLEKVHQLLYSSYHPDEPVTRHLGLCKGLNSIPDADRMVEQILLKNLTLIVEDSTGTPIGVAVNNDCLGSDVTPTQLELEMSEVKDPKYKPLVAIRHQLRLQNAHVYQEVGTDKFFSIRMVGVDPKERGKGIATDLIRRSVLLAGSLGYVGIKTEVTGNWSMKAFETIGLMPTSSIKYSDFTYEDKHVLEGVINYKGDTEVTFMKKKFFQSALKHIL